MLRWLIPEIHGVWLILPGMVAQTLAMGMFVPMLAPFAQHHLGLHPQQYALVLMAGARWLRQSVKWQVRHQPWMWILVVVSSLGVVAGCGTLPNGRGWGQDATPWPGWQRVRTAAVDAALAPATWAPVAGALTLQVGDMDKKLSRWASDHTPVFGSQTRADRASDLLRDTANAAYWLTALSTPSGERPKEWGVAKLKGLTVGMVAVALTSGATEVLKAQIKRSRPDVSGTTSFPSGHASNAAVHATLASRNLESLQLPDWGRTAGRIGLATLMVGTAWARVEAKEHFPSDALAGAAIGHFLGAFLTMPSWASIDPNASC